MNNFIELIEGHYRNQRQAMSAPANWPQIDIRIWTVASGIFESKSWYKYLGEKKPYNWLRYSIVENTEDTVVTKLYSVLEDKDIECPITWTWDGFWWNGSNGECVVNNIKARTRVRFNGYDYRTQDQGIDLTTGEQRWGKKPEEGEFLFVRLDK